MNRRTAKQVVLDILDRWSRMDGRGRGRFVVDKAQSPISSSHTAYIFTSRNEAIRFGETRFRGDYVVLAITDRGAVDITPA